MLLSFSASNYKSIKEAQTVSMVGTKLRGSHNPISVDVPNGGNGVLPCAVIYGANASGKSNILDALFRMRQMMRDALPTRGGNDGISRIAFKLDDDWARKPTEFGASFLIKGIRFDYGFSFDDNEILEEWLFSFPEGRRRRLYERSGRNVEFGPAMKGAKKALVGFMRQNALFIATATQNGHAELSSVVEFFDHIHFSNRITVGANLLNNFFEKDEIDPRTISFLETIGTGVISYRQVSSERPERIKMMLSDFIELMKKHSNSPAKDESPTEIPDKDTEIELAHRGKSGKDVYFPGNLESAGTRRLLVLLNDIFRALDTGGLAIIDELDASLHTFAVEAVITMFIDQSFNKHGAQLIATTHDTNLLDPERLRRDEIWFVEKSATGESSYFSLAEIVSRKGESFERAYLKGRYGALPPKLDHLDFTQTVLQSPSEES